MAAHLARKHPCITSILSLQPDLNLMPLSFLFFAQAIDDVVNDRFPISYEEGVSNLTAWHAWQGFIHHTELNSVTWSVNLVTTLTASTAVTLQTQQEQLLRKKNYFRATQWSHCKCSQNPGAAHWLRSPFLICGQKSYAVTGKLLQTPEINVQEINVQEMNVQEIYIQEIYVQVDKLTVLRNSCCWQNSVFGVVLNMWPVFLVFFLPSKGLLGCFACSSAAWPSWSSSRVCLQVNCYHQHSWLISVAQVPAKASLYNLNEMNYLFCNVCWMWMVSAWAVCNLNCSMLRYR